MKRAIALSTWLVLAGCATPLPQHPPGGVPARVTAPDIRVGDNWAYAFHDGYTKLSKGTLVYRVSAVQGDTVSVEVMHGERLTNERYTRDWNWLERPMTNLQNFRYSPAYAALPFPLEAGKSWRAYVQATDPATGRVNRVRIDGKVLGWERVKVPAGEFDALRIRRLVYAGNFGHFRSEEQIVEFDWYAPRLGRVVRQESSSLYYDTSRGCGKDDPPNCQVVRNDWNVAELINHPHGTSGKKP